MIRTMHRLAGPLRVTRTATQVFSAAPGERAAVAELLAQMPASKQGFTLLFCTPHYDLGRVGAALRHAGRERVMAAMTGRAIGIRGFAARGISGIHLPVPGFKVADALISDVTQFGLNEARQLVRALRRRLGAHASARLPYQFGLLVADAMPRCEERVTAALGTELAGVPLIGGSAGDTYFHPDMQGLESSRVLHRGAARNGAAVFCLVASAFPIHALSHTHYVPDRRRRVVITEADPARRLVFEIDGRPALQAYQEAAGLDHPARAAGDFASHPLMVRIGGQYFARGLQRVHADGSLEFACAMEPGMVLSVARPRDMVRELSEMFARMRSAIGPPQLVVGFECAARTAEMEQGGLTAAVGRVFTGNSVTGFCTLGEQFGAIHVNNSFSCVGIGAGADT